MWEAIISHTAKYCLLQKEFNLTIVGQKISVYLLISHIKVASVFKEKKSLLANQGRPSGDGGGRSPLRLLEGDSRGGEQKK